ncbi:hypothetical protein, partial [Aerococcus mictus]|uniref:hypothetical protein n=1 Tax=Aerococcus mictus TaxID=2976810 RepID=UPI001C6572B1
IAWGPACMVDEFMPAPEKTPSDWIRKAVGDKWRVAVGVGAWLDNDFPYSFLVTPGEICKFISREDLGSVRVRLTGDGGYEVLDQVPVAANFFNVAFEFDCCGSTIADAISCELDGGGDIGAEIEIICIRWSDEIPHRFEIGKDGPRFVAVEQGAQA